MENNISPPPDQLHTIFVDTSIGTHLAMVVSIHDTVSDVKAKIRAEHAICFQEFGDISVKAIKVRRRCFFYNLSDSMYILNAFDGIKGTWRICIDAIPMCAAKNQNAFNNEVTHECVKHNDYKAHTLDVNVHHSACDLLPKNQKSIMNNEVANVDHLDSCVSPSKPGEICRPNGHESQKAIAIDHKNGSDILIDQVKDAPEGSDAILSDIHTHKTIYEKSCKALLEDELIESPIQHHFLGRKRIEKRKDVLHVKRSENFEESKLSRVKVIEESNKLGDALQHSIIPHESRDPLQIPFVEKHIKSKKRKPSKSHEDVHFIIPPETIVCQSHLGTTDAHNLNKVMNDLIFSGKCQTKPNTNESSLNNGSVFDTASIVEVSTKKRTRHIVEKNKESIKKQILQINVEGQGEKQVTPRHKINAEASLRDTMPVQNSLDKMLAKRRKKKSSKSHEEDPLAMPSKTLRVAADPHISGSRANPVEYLSYNNTDVSSTCGTTNFLKSSIEKEIKHSLELINEKPFEECILEINTEDQSKKHVNLCQESNIDVSIKKSDETIFSQIATEFSTELQCNTNKLKRRTNRVSKHMESTDVLSKESNATNCVTGLKFQNVETTSIEAKTGIMTSGKKEKATKVDSKDLSKSKHSNRKSKSNLLEEPREKNVKDHFKTVGGQVDLEGTQKDPSATKFIKQADQKVEDLNAEFVAKILPSFESSSSQEKGSDPHDLSKAANTFIEHATEIKVSSQINLNLDKPHRSRKALKSGLPNLESQDNCGVFHSKIHSKAADLIDVGEPDQSKLTSMNNQKMELHCADEKAALHLSGEHFSMLAEVPQVTSKLQYLSEQRKDQAIIKDVASHIDAGVGQFKSKGGRKRSKKGELIEAIVSLKTSEHTEPDIFVDSIVSIDDFLIPKKSKQSPAVYSPSKKYETEKKNKSKKANMIQSFQDSQHMAAALPQKNDTTNVNLNATAIKDSMTGITRKAKDKQSGKLNTYLHKANDKHMLDRKLQDTAQLHAQALKSGSIECKLGKVCSFEPVHGFDNLILKDLNPSTTRKLADDMPRSEGVDFRAASSDTTEDTLEEKRYRLVRKISLGKSKGLTKSFNSEKALLISPGRMFSDASSMSSESEKDPCKKKSAVDSVIDDEVLSGDLESYLGEDHTNANTESDEQGETSKGADLNPKNQSLDRIATSTQKAPLRNILKGSSSYKKVKLIASQSEFPDDESQPTDMVLETQPEIVLP